MKTEKEIKKLYNEKGLNSIHAYLKRNNINYKQEIIEFGLQGNKKAEKAKKEFLKGSLCFHYYSQGVTSYKTKYMYNILRGTKITINN